MIQMALSPPRAMAREMLCVCKRDSVTNNHMRCAERELVIKGAP